MKSLFFALIAVMVFSGNVFARDVELEKVIISCSKLDTDEKKLNCFNEIANALEKIQKPDDQSFASSKEWRLKRANSPMDDSKSFIALLDGSDSTGSDKATLVLRCTESKTSSYIVWKEMLNYSGNIHTVEYRIDDKKPVKARWNLSSDNKATFAPQEIKFAKELSGAKKLIARTSYYNKSPSIVTFNLDGVDEIVKELQETCHWK